MALLSLLLLLACRIRPFPDPELWDHVTAVSAQLCHDMEHGWAWGWHHTAQTCSSSSYASLALFWLSLLTQEQPQEKRQQGCSWHCSKPQAVAATKTFKENFDKILSSNATVHMLQQQMLSRLSPKAKSLLNNQPDPPFWELLLHNISQWCSIVFSISLPHCCYHYYPWSSPCHFLPGNVRPNPHSVKMQSFS